MKQAILLVIAVALSGCVDEQRVIGVGDDGGGGGGGGDDGIAAGGPTVGGELVIETAVPGFTGGRAREPSIAPSTNRYLAVWRDDRTGYSNDIFAARINPDGTIRDPRGLHIASQLDSNADMSAPEVVWLPNRGDWLVAWMNESAGGTWITAATVGPGGAVTQLGQVAGSTGASSLDLAADAGVAILTFDVSGDVFAVRFGPSGFGSAFDVAVDPAIEEASPTVSGSNGGDFLVAWQSGATGADIRGRRVARSGVTSGASFDVSIDAGVQSTPAATFAGGNYVLTWKSGPDEIWGARVGPTGIVLDTTGTVGGVAIATGATILTDPDVSCDATSCLFAWEDRTDTVNNTTGIYGQLRAIADFAVVGGRITIDEGERSQNNVAMTPRTAGGGQLVLFDDRSIGIHNVSMVRVDGTGTVLDADPLLVNTGERNSQRTPGYARSATGQLAVWRDSRVFGDDIMAMRFNASGGKVDGTLGARVVSDAADTQTTPAIGFDGTQYVVVWSDSRNPTFDIFAARFLDDGTNLDPAGIALATADRNQTAPAVAAGGGGSLIAWIDESDPTTRADIVGAILAADGTFTSLDICRTDDAQQNPAIAWDPTSSVYVVVWEDFRNGTDFDVYATRVQPDGTTLDGCGVLVAGGALDQRRPGIATSGTQQLVVWEDYSGGSDGDVRASRLDASSGIAVLDAGGLAIAVGADLQLHPAVGGLDGGRWSLAWETTGATGNLDIAGNELASTGALLGPAYAIANSDEYEHGPQFQNGVNDSNVTYLVYQRTRTGSSIVKAMRRRITH